MSKKKIKCIIKDCNNDAKWQGSKDGMFDTAWGQCEKCWAKTMARNRSEGSILNSMSKHELGVLRHMQATNKINLKKL